jgi:uncharacterized membrane protein (DUF106 family)
MFKGNRWPHWLVSQAHDGQQPPAPEGGQMFMMLIFMLLMTFLLMNEGFRTGLSGYAEPVLSPWLPEESYFIITILIIGSCSMLVNTVLRNFFIDPIQQAHIGHRMGQVRRMSNDARMSRDAAKMEKAQKLQMHIMPEQTKITMGGMKPMMFTFIFIIAIFSWIGMVVSDFRVGYVSLPWISKWDMLGDKFLFFPAWIATYICLSAPLGRAVDRHIKLWRYKSHPVVVAGETIKEPLLHLVATDETKTRMNRSRHHRGGPRKQKSQQSTDSSRELSSDITGSVSDAVIFCPQCDNNIVARLDGRNHCKVCMHRWR